MKRTFYFFLLIFFTQNSFAQENLSWQGYFSYTEIKDLSASTTQVFAASENALFSKNLTTNVVKTTNTIDGLSGQTISALYHSAASIKPWWYENGLIIAINETDGTLLNIVDIINKQLPPNIKKINHFMEIGGTAPVILGLFNSTWRLCNLGILILLVTMVPKL
jgi:hypothetical protein